MTRHASRSLLIPVLKDWPLDRAIPFASVVVSQLVASSSADTGTDIDLSVAWYAGALRLTIGNHGSALPGQRPAASTCRGQDSPSSWLASHARSGFSPPPTAARSSGPFGKPQRPSTSNGKGTPKVIP